MSRRIIGAAAAGGRGSGSGPGTGAQGRSPGRRRGGLRWLGWLAAGVAVTAGAGYLVAALLLFPAPLRGGERRVVRVLGLTESEARAELTPRDLATAVTGSEPHPTATPGSVIWQDPPPGVAVPRGTTVALVLSGGPPRVAVPDVAGLDSDLAARLLSAAGLRIELIDSVATKVTRPGIAVGTDPRAGDSLTVGSGVILHLAQ